MRIFKGTIDLTEREFILTGNRNDSGDWNYKSRTTLKNLMDARKKIVCVTFGSGGHTGEMLEILRMLDLSDVQEIIAVVFSNDIQTCKKVKNCTLKMQNESISFSLVPIPRPRNIGSLIFASVPRTIWSIIVTFYRLSFVSIPNIVKLSFYFLRF